MILTVIKKSITNLTYAMIAIENFYHSAPRNGVRQRSGGRLTIHVQLIDDFLKLGLGRVLSQRPHHVAQFLGRDDAVTVLVE